MDCLFRYERETLYCEGVPLADIAASAGTPCYVYSSKAILDRFHAYEDSLAGIPHAVCYAVKANSNLGILALLAKTGAGFDIVSGGELYRVLKAGASPGKVVFSGVGKTAEEVEYALEQGIHSFNCESEPELALIDSLAGRLGKRARVALRVNPDVDAATHPYISTGLSEHKFGIDIRLVEAIYDRSRTLRNIELDGVSCHIGSQLLDPAPLLEALDRLLALVDRLRAKGTEIRHLDLGGGIGVPYKRSDPAPDIAGFVREVRKRIEGRNLKLMLEPGRSIVAEAGVLLTRVLYRKTTPRKEFIVVDAAMNDLIRPSLYGSYHEIIPLRSRTSETITADVVGPVCESGDFLAKDRQIANVFPGDLLAVCTSGAYGFVAASNYNSRPRPAEVLVEGSQWRMVRQRETLKDLIRGESV
jgi:diaminopimelate decarboxylase